MYNKNNVVEKQMTDCDILFMIPGRMDKSINKLPSRENPDGKTFIAAIEDSMDELLDFSENNFQDSTTCILESLKLAITDYIEVMQEKFKK